MPRPIIACACAIIVLAAACRQRPPAVKDPRPTASPKAATGEPFVPRALPPEETKAAVASLAEEAADRRLMIIPASPDFHPMYQGKRLAVRITPKTARLKAGAPFEVKIELQNVGAETYAYSQHDSILKSAGAYDSKWTFFRKGPDGKRVRIGRPIGTDGGVGDARTFSSQEARSFLERARAFSFLHAELRPGETLVSLPRSGSEGADWRPSENSRLVTVSTPYEFTVPGRYEVQAEHACDNWNSRLLRLDPEEVFISLPIWIEVVP